MQPHIKPMQRIVEALMHYASGLQTCAARAPGGPFVNAPGPALLTMGQATGGAARATFLPPESAVTLFGFQTSGAGAMQDSLVAQQIARQGAYVFLDVALDRERQDMLAYLHRKAGTLDDFYVLNVDNPACSHTYNPLAHGTAHEVALRLTHAMMSPIYDEAPLSTQECGVAVSLLTPLVQALQERDGVAMFQQLFAVLSDAEALSALANAHEVRLSTQLTLKHYFAPYQQPGDRYDMDAIRAPLTRMIRHLSAFVAGKLGQVVNVVRPDIDLTDILQARKGLFVMLPTMGKDSTAITLGRLVLADLQDSLAARGDRMPDGPQPPPLVVSVELPVLATGRLDALFGAARSAGVDFVAGVAGVSNLRLISEADRAALLAPGHTKVFFRASPRENPEDRRTLGGMLTAAGAPPEVPALLEQLGNRLEGQGVVIRGSELAAMKVWPQIEVAGGFAAFEVSRPK